GMERTNPLFIWRGTLAILVVFGSGTLIRRSRDRSFTLGGAGGLARPLVAGDPFAECARRPQLDVLLRELGLGRASLEHGEHNPGGESSGRDEEAGVCDHPMVGAD